MSTRNGTDIPRSRPRTTRCTSRALKRNAISPSAPFSTLAPLSIVQSPEVLSLLVAEIGLGRRQVRPIGWSLETVGGDRNQSFTDVLDPGLPQQPLNDPFARFVPTLAELVVPDSRMRVGDVNGEPVVVAERAPDPIVAVDRDRRLDFHAEHVEPAHGGFVVAAPSLAPCAVV